MIKHLLKKIFRTLGYNLVRIKPIVPPKIFAKSNMPLYIEFMGPSGVGKTTILKETFKIKERNLNWLTPEEFIKLENLSVNDEIFGSTYQEIINCKINKVIAQDLISSNKLRLFSFLYSNIKDIALVHHYNKNYTILSDEGFFHNFGDSISDLHKTSFEGFSTIISNSAIVYCTAKPEIIANQIMERDSLSYLINPYHQYKNLRELIEYQNTSLEEIDKCVRLFRQFNIPVLDIHTTNDPKENAIKVREFITKVVDEKNLTRLNP